MATRRLGKLFHSGDIVWFFFSFILNAVMTFSNWISKVFLHNPFTGSILEVCNWLHSSKCLYRPEVQHVLTSDRKKVVWNCRGVWYVYRFCAYNSCWSWWVGKLTGYSWPNASCSLWIRMVRITCIFTKACKFGYVFIYGMLRDGF